MLYTHRFANALLSRYIGKKFIYVSTSKCHPPFRMQTWHCREIEFITLWISCVPCFSSVNASLRSSLTYQWPSQFRAYRIELPILFKVFTVLSHRYGRMLTICLYLILHFENGKNLIVKEILLVTLLHNFESAILLLIWCAWTNLYVRIAFRRLLNYIM